MRFDREHWDKGWEDGKHDPTPNAEQIVRLQPVLGHNDNRPSRADRRAA